VWEFALMSNLESAETRLSFDDILEAVQDSKRGRWFLQEFETRLQKRDTTSLLSAMARLESRVGELSQSSGKPENLGAVSAAIASARSDLLKLGLGKEAMSSEGKLFAELAEMARKAMPAATEARAGIVRALELVNEIDTAVTPMPKSDRGAQYFKSDADLFERKPIPTKPVLVAATEPTAEAEPSQKPNPPATGAKLTIRRTSTTTAPSPAGEEAPKSEPVRAEVEPVEFNQPEMPAIDNPRIVIIRRKAEDMPDVTAGVESAA
jgi:hypothetical protein